MPIVQFTEEYRFLSNFYPCKVEIYGIVFPSSEHAFVAFKTTDEKLRQEIALISTPGQVKHFGRNIELRPDWEDVKLNCMKNIVKAKFDQNPDLKAKLCSTYPEKLIEGNTWGDRFWGESPIGNGQNHLGRILMDLRDYYVRMERWFEV